MSNLNNENTKPIKPLSTEDTQPTSIGESWIKPVADDSATMPVPVARTRKAKPLVEEPALDEAATVPITTPKPRGRKTSAEAPAAETQGFAKSVSTTTPEPPRVTVPQPSNTDAEPPINEEEPPTKKVKRGKWIWLGILGMLILILAGAGVGYASAIRARVIEQNNQRLITATTQFELGLVDQREGRFETAKKRFEYVLSIYPEFPGVTDKLVEVGLAIAEAQGGMVVTTPDTGGAPETIVTPVPTKDTTSVSILFNQAQNQLRAKDWEGLYTTLDKMRFIDPEYEPVKTDGMLYLTLRNRGISQIQAGHLEPGLYSFALASQIAPIDSDAEGYYTWASRYLKAASYGLVDEFLDDAVAQFAELYSMVPNLRDASGMTVAQRYAQSLVYLGDYYQRNSDFCGAVPYYQQASGIYALVSLSEKISQAEENCKNPPVVELPTAEATLPPVTAQPTVPAVITPLPTVEIPTVEPSATAEPSPQP